MTTVRIKSYTPGFFEGIFTRLAERTKLTIFLYVAALFRATRNFFARTWNKLKAIQFNKENYKFYAAHMFLNLMFFTKGLVGLITLGLFNPNITAKASIYLARTRKDVTDLRAGKILDEEVEAGIDILNDDEKDKTKNSKVPRYQRERIRRSSLSQEDMDDEIEKKLAALSDE